MGLISIPWSCVTALKLEPVGPISPGVFGLRHIDSEFNEWWLQNEKGGVDTGTYWVASRYAIVDPHKVRQMRDALGTLVDSPTGLRRPEKTPWYLALTSLHRGLTE